VQQPFREITFGLLEQLADKQKTGGGTIALLERREGRRVLRVRMRQF